MISRAFTCCAASSMLMTLTVAGAALPAAAQNANSGVGIGSSQELSRPSQQRASPAIPSVEHVFDGGDLGRSPADSPRRISPPTSGQRPSAPPPP